jgi:dynein heavy chain
LDRENATVKPQDGVYICGLFIEGAVWDRKKKTISDAPPALMYFSMPVIQFIPTDSYSPKIEDY